MFTIVLANPQATADNPFKINFDVAYTPPVASGDLFIVWLYDDNDILA